MANQFFTGFEGITAAQILRRFNGVGGSGSGTMISATSNRFGQSWQMENTCNFPVAITGTPSALYAGFAARPINGYGTTGKILSIKGDTADHVTLWHNVGLRRYEVRGPDGSTVLCSSATNSAPHSIYKYVEVGLLALSDTVGAVELRIEGIVVASATNVDTKGADSTITRVVLGSTFDYGWICDDFYINDSNGSAPHNTFYGDVRIDRVDPAADDAVQFTPLSSTNESNIDDGNTPDDDTTYNSSSAAGDQDTFALSGYVAPSGTILGMAVRSVMRKTDAGARTAASVVKGSAGTVVAGTAESLTTSYSEVSQYAYVDPETSAAFADAAAINATKIGYKIVA